MDVDGLRELWQEVLGAEARFDASFLANGGDSFKATVFAVQVFENHAREVDYLDVLEAADFPAVQRIVASSGNDQQVVAQS
ncbi:hypothetical protein FHS29_000254 [Saccharothrix tamanrassetensis]|uniref:Carrier domain-containing protein n=1 Tax=Saccharothrix tamanrassetensis TaxID=1051531 RepID=A0A841CBF4_9PSEU|nr:phosphopantetheine-binding protein [Saccharothrix tamanrassetensis]MBB5953684.1 hypothetical protein [Saccharothrix tamanrassetensis]